MNKQIIFWGTPLFSLPSLKALDALGLVKAVVTQPDKLAGRNRELKTSAVKDYALAHDLAVLQPEALDQGFVDQLKEFLPTTFVIVAFGKIIPQEILDLSELSSLNIHPSKLPTLRGPSPIQTAFLEGFSSTAVTLMQLDEKMDHGPILGQIEAKINPDDDYITLGDRLSEIGGQILTDKIQDYLAAKLEPQDQDHEQATFCKLIKKEDGLIDWQKPAEHIINQIKAFILWPTSFTKLKNIEVQVIKAIASLEKLTPGEISITNSQLLIGTGTSALQILELKPAGKKKMLAEEFIRGYQDKL